MNVQDYHLHRRGATINPEGRFEAFSYETFDDGWDKTEEAQQIATSYLPEYAKTIINTNKSPDIPFDTSINPYRGCEHGCVYCFARPSHSFTNLSPGLDFESKIFYKKDTVRLLEKEFAKKKYRPKPIALGINTDAYQPIEKKLGITRSLLEVFCKYKHPVSLITKSSLITRDLDLMTELASQNLLHVFVSLTTMEMKLYQKLEPRTATPKKRLAVIEKLAKAGIPVGVMCAPMIPALNDMELETLLQNAKDAGAKRAGYVLLRLPFEVKDIFANWLHTHYPLKEEHVWNLIRSTRGGKEYDASYGQRMSGTGEYAKLLRKRFRLAVKRLGFNQENLKLRTDLFAPPSPYGKQLLLFEDL
ncbi:MAG: PA0069 family radical SAM protein [Spirochaetota bacterium]